jgi:hypothetical protein
LHKRFEVLDARLERTQLLLLGIGDGTVCRIVSRLGHATDLADPSDQPLMLAHSSPSTRPPGLGGARRVPAALLV